MWLNINCDIYLIRFRDPSTVRYGSALLYVVFSHFFLTSMPPTSLHTVVFFSSGPLSSAFHNHSFTSTATAAFLMFLLVRQLPAFLALLRLVNQEFLFLFSAMASLSPNKMSAPTDGYPRDRS